MKVYSLFRAELDEDNYLLSCRQMCLSSSKDKVINESLFCAETEVLESEKDFFKRITLNEIEDYSWDDDVPISLLSSSIDVILFDFVNQNGFHIYFGYSTTWLDEGEWPLTQLSFYRSIHNSVNV